MSNHPGSPYDHDKVQGLFLQVDVTIQQFIMGSIGSMHCRLCLASYSVVTTIIQRGGFHACVTHQVGNDFHILAFVEHNTHKRTSQIVRCRFVG